jgi:uncharacterized protein
MTRLRPVAVITGASSGIGAALAREFAARGHDLALVALPDPQLATLADEIATGSRHRPVTVELDLTQRDAGARLAHALGSQGVEPMAVVNCAGFGLVGGVDELDRGEQLAMVDLNVRALTELSLRFIDSLRRHRGSILNVASVSAFLPGPGMAVYNATKSFVLSFSEALHQELAGDGIRVTALCSGPVPTRFQQRAGIRARLPRLLARSPEFVARRAYAGLMGGRRVVVPGLGNKLLQFLLPLVPHRFLLPGKHAAMRFSAKPPVERNMPSSPRRPHRKGATTP